MEDSFHDVKKKGSIKELTSTFGDLCEKTTLMGPVGMYVNKPTPWVIWSYL